jgi:hypothetical protein
VKKFASRAATAKRRAYGISYHGARERAKFADAPSSGRATLRLAKPFPSTRLEDVVGCLRYAGKPRTLRQMAAAIGAEVKARRGRGRY